MLPRIRCPFWQSRLKYYHRLLSVAVIIMPQDIHDLKHQNRVVPTQYNLLCRAVVTPAAKTQCFHSYTHFYYCCGHWCCTDKWNIVEELLCTRKLQPNMTEVVVISMSYTSTQKYSAISNVYCQNHDVCKTFALSKHLVAPLHLFNRLLQLKVHN